MAVLFISCIGCDQVTKDVARDTLQGAPAFSMLFDSIHFIYAENPGVAFSLGAELSEPVRRLLLVGGVGIILLIMGLFLFLRRIDASAYWIGATLVMGGGIGNLLDRLLNNGHVIDFMMIRMGGLRTAIFNVADVLIIAGVILLVFSMLRSERQAKAHDAGASTVST